MVEQGLSPSRIRNAHQVLSQILAPHRSPGYALLDRLAGRGPGRRHRPAPRYVVGRCGSRSSSRASSSRRRPGPDSPTGCGSMTFATPARACSSPRAPASGGPGPARPCLGDGDIGPLRAPVPRRAPAARRPAPGRPRPGYHGPSTDRARPEDAPATQRGRSVTCLWWWRWGDSNSRPAASFQGFSERSRRLSFGPRLSGGDAPGS